MPTSPSPRRGAKAQSPAPRPAPPRSLWPRLALIGVVAFIVVVVCVLPASLITRFLPPTMQAEEFSGSLWHGSAGRITVAGHPAGALGMEHSSAGAPAYPPRGGPSLGQRRFRAGRFGRLYARAPRGVGNYRRRPVEDLRDFGLGAGWRGTAGVRLTELTADLSAAGAVLASAIGDITVSDISSPQVASGTNLGGYDLRFNDPARGVERRRLERDVDRHRRWTDRGERHPSALDEDAHRDFFGNRQGAPGHPAGAAQSAG